MKRLKQAYGNWVEDDRFWNRENDISLLKNKLDDGAHILLVAQRRMGKTSLMKEIKRRLGDSYISLFIDLQKAASAEDAIVELCLALKPHQTLWNKTKDLFANVWNRISGNIEELNITMCRCFSPMYTTDVQGAAGWNFSPMK